MCVCLCAHVHASTQNVVVGLFLLFLKQGLPPTELELTYLLDWLASVLECPPRLYS